MIEIKKTPPTARFRVEIKDCDGLMRAASFRATSLEMATVEATFNEHFGIVFDNDSEVTIKVNRITGGTK